MKACPICNFYSLPFLEGLLYLGLCPLRIPYSDLPFKMVLPRAHLQCGGPGFSPWVRKIPWRRKWQPTPVFLPGEFHGQRGLEGYSPWGHKRVGHNIVTEQQQQIQGKRMVFSTDKAGKKYDWIAV